MWQYHWVKNTLKSVLPFPHQLRYLKRRLGRSPHQIDEKSVYNGGFYQISLLADMGLDLRGLDILEMGTGWCPVIPLMMRLAGARHVVLTDVHASLCLETLNTTVKFLLERKTDLSQRLGITVAEIEDRLHIPQAGDFDAVIAEMGMTYAVPFDYKRSPVRVDAIISHTVLEHIPRQVIKTLMHDARRVLRPGGVISHGIDHSDHRAIVDQRLSQIDFLRYSDRMWKLFCVAPQDYTNRLRHSEYVAMFKEAGFEIMFESAYPDATCREASIPLAVRFQSMDLDDLATLWSVIVIRPDDPDRRMEGQQSRGTAPRQIPDRHPVHI